MDWYRRAQKIVETEGTVDFTVSPGTFSEWYKNLMSKAAPAKLVKEIEAIADIAFTIPYIAELDMSGIEPPGIAFDLPEGMEISPQLSYYLRGMVHQKIDEDLKASPEVEDMKDEHFAKRLMDTFVYRYDMTMHPNPVDWKEKDAGPTLSGLHGKDFLIHYSADYLAQGVYNIRPYRPEEIPTWVWEEIYKDVVEKAKPHAFAKLDKIRYESNPVNTLSDLMLEEEQ